MTACPLIPITSPTFGAISEPTLCEILAPHNRHLFITPKSAFTELSLELTKTVLDKSAENLIDAQLKRTREIREQKKRKRKNLRQDEDEKVLRIKQIHIQGFAIENVWEQARRVIDALREDVEKRLRQAEQNGIAQGEERISNGTYCNEDDDQYSSISFEAASTEANA